MSKPLAESSVSCNCAWMMCPVHTNGLCSNTSMAFDDTATCGHVHYLGESLGDDIHICRPCADVLVDITRDRIPELMGRLTPYVPEWMRLLNTFVSREYMAKLGAHRLDRPQNDAYAAIVMGFLVVQEDKEGKIPMELVERLTELSIQVQQMITAYSSVPMAVEKEAK